MENRNASNLFLNLKKDVLLKLIPQHGRLTNNNISNLSQTCRTAYSLFHPIISQAAQLLECVAFGKQEEAESIIRKCPGLMFEKKMVQDYSFRRFCNISAVQYSAWAGDIAMLKMLLSYLAPGEEKLAFDQLDQLDRYGTEHGPHYDPTPLVRHLMTYDMYRSTWPKQKKDEYINKIMGGEQRNVPAHVAQEYCSLAFNSKKIFNGPSILKRSFMLKEQDGKNQSPWFPLNEKNKLGQDFAVLANIDQPEEDAKALIRLFVARMFQYQEIKSNLLSKCANEKTIFNRISHKNSMK